MKAGGGVKREAGQATDPGRADGADPGGADHRGPAPVRRRGLRRRGRRAHRPGGRHDPRRPLPPVRDKADLFAAVLDQVEAEIAQRVAGAVAGFDPADSAGMLLAGAGAWLDASTEPDLQQIVLLDGPSVLGWGRWREICLRHTVGLIAALLQDGIDRGSLPPQPVQALTHVLVGAVDEAALYIAQAGDGSAARADMDIVLRRLTLALTAPA
jgi:AcrR family transcriptional regulator